MKEFSLNSLDDFITWIVMNFEDAEPVKKILSKLGDIRKNGNEYLVKFEDNSLVLESRNGKFKQSIFIDTENKKLRLEELGVKNVKHDDEWKDSFKATKTYFTKQVYSVFDDKSTNYTYSKEYTIAKYYDNTKIVANISKCYTFFDNNKFLGKSYDADKSVVLKDRNNNTISNDSTNIYDNVYVLPTGDMLERCVKDGEVSCYFASGKSTLDDAFKKEITEGQLDELMSLGNAPYVVANNDIVYGVRKTNYS